MSNVKGQNNKLEDSIPTDQKPKKILVVGDWFVDEHWVMGVHRSASSSRTGDAHYRALHNMSSTVQSFCGAGLTASLLYQVEENNKRLFDIYGIGLWHHNDTDILKEMFEVQNLKGQTLFKINRQPPNLPQGVELFNLSGLLSKKNREKICTTRIIRLYHSVHPDDVKFYRMDWELPRVEIQKNKIKEMESTLPPDIDAVVIKDLLKGVVSPPLVAKLVEKYGKKAKWFVSSKAWNPTWLEELRKVDLQLLIIPQIAADEAIREGILSCWITRAGYPGEDVFECINKIIDKIGPQNSGFKLIVLPKGFSVIAYMPYKKLNEQEQDKIDCIIQPEVTPHPPLVPMGMASVFLPAVISYHLQQKGEEKKFREVLENCLRCTYKWVKFQGKRVMQPEDWDPKSDSGIFMKLDSNDETISECHFVFKNVAWKNEQEIWKQATYGTGVINVISEKKQKKHLELWRSMIEVDGYVCCVKGKRKELHRLITGIESFCKGEKKHHVGCMLVATPGSGKSSLVRRLANSLNLRFLPFNITQMSSRNDIIDCFDTIVTTQAQDRTQPILVFIDEINAKLDNSPVYDAFLAPIEDGIYIRGGKAFHIDPCLDICRY